MIVLNHIFGGMCRVVTIATKKKKKKKLIRRYCEATGNKEKTWILKDFIFC